MEDLHNSHVQLTGEPADLIFLVAEGRSKLPQIRTLAAVMNRDGAIWVVYPRGIEKIVRST